MRVRALGGDIPDEDQLAAKIEVLQERLNEKREQLLERHLVLDEVSHLRYERDKSDVKIQSANHENGIDGKKLFVFHLLYKDTNKSRCRRASAITFFTVF